MKVFRDGKYIKIIPKHFKSAIGGFDFDLSRKRLTPSERYYLIQRLVRLDFLGEETRGNRQKEYAARCVSQAGIIDIIKVIRRNGVDWRIRACEVEIRVEASLVSDCPNEFLEVKHEF